MKICIGDTIGIIALSGDCESEPVERAKCYFENLGYRVKLSKNIYDKNRYLAGSDDDKIEELHNFFKDPEIKLIMAARGGYGAIRLVEKIDYSIIKNNPKFFCGFSDVTALLLMIYKKTGIITYHSPMACSDFGQEEVSEYTADNFFKMIGSKMAEYEGNVLKSGVSKGVLWGGNLSTVVSLCGTDFLPDKDFIFFAEDINEPVYKIDKMFQQLMNISDFMQRCKGIVLGDFIGTDDNEQLKEYFNELVSRINVPVISIDKITHGKDKITLPVGAKAEINGSFLKLY